MILHYQITVIIDHNCTKNLTDTITTFNDHVSLCLNESNYCTSLFTIINLYNIQIQYLSYSYKFVYCCFFKDYQSI